MTAQSALLNLLLPEFIYLNPFKLDICRFSWKSGPFQTEEMIKYLHEKVELSI